MASTPSRAGMTRVSNWRLSRWRWLRRSSVLTRQVCCVRSQPTVPPAFESDPHLTSLADAFWSWRVVTQPLSGDDIPRIERPPGWVPDWSPEAVKQQRGQLKTFEADWHALAKGSN